RRAGAYRRLEESFTPREQVGDNSLGCEEKHSPDEQVPPDVLASLRFGGCQFSRLLLLPSVLTSPAGHRGNHLVRIKRGQIGLGRVEVDSNSVGTPAARRRRADLVEAVLGQLEQARLAGGNARPLTGGRDDH